MMPWISRADRLLSRPLEGVFDRLGHGFMLICVAQRNGRAL
jgi:hypothetical protein